MVKRKRVLNLGAQAALYYYVVREPLERNLVKVSSVISIL